MSKVIVIGGGISGLSVAYQLTLLGISDVEVWEAESRTGGKAYTLQKDGFYLESGSNGWLDKEPAVNRLICSLGIEDRVQPSNEASARRFIFRSGHLRELHLHPLKFMFSSALPLSARLRLTAEPFIHSKKTDDDESLADFATRRLGKGAAKWLIGPMASGVYAGDPDQMSLRSCFPKIFALEKKYGSLIKGMAALKREKKALGENPSEITAGPSGRLTSMKSGISELVDALTVALGNRIKTDMEVAVVEHALKNRFTVKTRQGIEDDCDAVISAAPAYAAAKYLALLDHDAALALSQIPYPALDVVCLAFKKEDVLHDFNGFGFLAPRDQGLTILGSLWTSSIFQGRAPDNFVLFRTMIGGMTEPQVSEWNEPDIIKEVRHDLKTAIGLKEEVTPVLSHVFRHTKAIPQYHIGHEKLVEKFSAAENHLPGLLIRGNFLGGIGIVNCIKNSELTAKKLMSILGSHFVIH